jgi:antitoxin (DNA-binding transcriptional repressor) of toxin-antitoxin stability system
MAEPAVPIPHRPLELSLMEARTRFAQLVRLAGLTRQITIVADGGRPLAAIVPVDLVQGREDAVATTTQTHHAPAGWIRRIDKVRTDLRQQHGALERALHQAWEELDKVRPPGADRDVDALRASHADLRRTTSPS